MFESVIANIFNACRYGKRVYFTPNVAESAVDNCFCAVVDSVRISNFGFNQKQIWVRRVAQITAITIFVILQAVADIENVGSKILNRTFEHNGFQAPAVVEGVVGNCLDRCRNDY